MGELTIRYITRLEKPITCSFSKKPDQPVVIFELTYPNTEIKLIPFLDLDEILKPFGGGEYTREDIAIRIGTATLNKYSFLDNVKITVGIPEEDRFVASYTTAPHHIFIS